MWATICLGTLIISVCNEPSALSIFLSLTSFYVVDVSVGYCCTWSHSDTPHSVGLLWTIDRTVAETCAWQHTTLTKDRHPCPHRDSNPQSQQLMAVDPSHRPAATVIDQDYQWVVQNRKEPIRNVCLPKWAVHPQFCFLTVLERLMYMFTHRREKKRF